MNNAVRYQVMPPLAPDEYQELHDDIKINGVLDPIHVDEDGVVIDGHHRSKIANELGVPCPVITHDDLDDAGKRSLAFTLNLKRRHLNREQRRALIAESLKTDPQLSNREHARRTGASDKTVGSLRGEMEESAEIPHFEKRVDPRTGNASQSASQSKREVNLAPVSEWPDDKPAPVAMVGPNEEIPDTNIIGTEDLDELNQPAPEVKPEPPKPRPEPVTSRFTSAVNDLNRVLDKFHRISTDRNFNANKNQVATLHGHDLARAISELQNLADQLN